MSSSTWQTRDFLSVTQQTRSGSAKMERVLRSRLSGSRNREKRWVLGEHLKQIKSLNKRIAEIGSLNQRKKKTYDMIGHPVLFLRNNKEDNPKVRSAFVEKVLKRPKKIQAYEEVLRIKKSSFELSKEEQISDLSDLIFNVIVQRRLYKDEQLDKFFSKIRKNCSFEKSWIEEAIGLALTKLEM